MASLSTSVDGLRSIQLIRYTRLSGVSIIVFDHIITFDREVKFVWKSKWSLVKVLFFINRYYTLAWSLFTLYALFSPNLTDLFCLRYYQNEAISGLIGCMVADGALQIRIYALYGADKRILTLMLTVFTMCAAVSAWIFGKALLGLAVVAVEIPGGRFCNLPTIPPHIYVFWVPQVFIGTLLCALALIRAFQSFKSHGSLFYQGQCLIDILIRDSVMYFLVIGLAILGCLIVWVKEKNALVEVPIAFSVALVCSLCSRIILNLREAHQGDNSNSVIMSDFNVAKT